MKANSERNTISVITDDSLWNGAIGDSIRKGLTMPVLGLMYEEPEFSLNQYPAVLFEDYMGKSRHLLSIKLGSPTRFLTSNSSEVEGQTIYELQAPTEMELAKLWSDNAPHLRKHITESELYNVIQEIQHKSVYEHAGLLDFPYAFQVPTDYALRKDLPDFRWYKKEIVSGSASFLFYTIPYVKSEDMYALIPHFICSRDALTSKEIVGALEKSPMLVEDAFAPHIHQQTWNNQSIYVLRGSWEMRNNFMNGPFIAYLIPDETKAVFWVAEGFCYTPTRKKRDILTELEAVLWHAKPDSIQN